MKPNVRLLTLFVRSFQKCASVRTMALMAMLLALPIASSTRVMAAEPPATVKIGDTELVGVCTVTVTSKGMITIRHQGGVMGVAVDQVPKDFLAGWKWTDAALQAAFAKAAVAPNADPAPPVRAPRAADPPQPLIFIPFPVPPPAPNAPPRAPNLTATVRWQPGVFTPINAIIVEGRIHQRPWNANDFSFAIELKNPGRVTLDRVVVRAQAHKRRQGRIFDAFLIPIETMPFTLRAGSSQWVIAQNWQNHGEDYVGYWLEVWVDGKLIHRETFP